MFVCFVLLRHTDVDQVFEDETLARLVAFLSDLINLSFAAKHQVIFDLLFQGMIWTLRFGRLN